VYNNPAYTDIQAQTQDAQTMCMVTTAACAIWWIITAPLPEPVDAACLGATAACTFIPPLLAPADPRNVPDDDETDPPTPPGDTEDQTDSDDSFSQDPNELIGPKGFGAIGFVRPDVTLPYRINFENDAAATAPAQVVDLKPSAPTLTGTPSP
jgi:hypothetical protein